MSGILDPQPTSPEARLWQKIANLEERIKVLERKPVIVFNDAGAPASTVGVEGELRGALTNRIYLKVGGVWKSTVVA
jgi:hypothetical protein